MKPKNITRIAIGLILGALCCGIFYHHMVGSAQGQSIYDYWAENTDVSVSGYHYVYASLSYGDEITGLIQSHMYDDGFNFFICDQTNFDLYEGGFSCSVYHLETSMHILWVDFTIPSSETWYFVIENDEIFTIEVDYYFDLNGDNSPYYNPASYDVADNYETIDGYFSYYPLGDLKKGDTVTGQYGITFYTDSVIMMIVDESDKDRLVQGYSAVPLEYKNGYYRADIGPVVIPVSGEYFIFFDASYEDDTITLSFGVTITKGFPLVPVLIGAGAGVVALAVIIPVAVVASKKKKARLAGQGPSVQPTEGTQTPPQDFDKRFCDKCGMKLQPGAVFCPACGKSLK